MLRKKLFLAGMAAAMGALACTGCGSGSTTSETTAAKQEGTEAAAGEEVPSGNSGKAVEIEFFSLKPEAMDCYESLINRFNEENPDVHVTLTSTSDAQTVFLTRVSTNDIPELCYVYYNATYIEFEKEGLFEDLTGDPILDLVDKSIQDMAYVDDSIYCVPVTLSPAGIYYNVDLFEEKGYTYPQTYEELIALCEQMKADGITPFAFSDKTVSTIGQRAERLLGGNINYQVADKFAEVGAGNTSWTQEPELRRLAEVELELHQYCQDDFLGTAHEDAIAMFVNQEVAMIYSGTWAATTINDGEPDFRYEMLSFPAIDGVTPYACTNPDTCYAISSACTEEERDGAYRFMEFLLSQEAMEEWLQTDLSPNMAVNAEYDVDCFSTLTKEMNEGAISLLPSVTQPAGFRNSWQVLIQQLLIDQDIDAFLQASDEVTMEYYN